ncbi:VRR-NUC domain-containing protein [Pseudomonas parafulva]|uniref:VRR-NUC domain-containing protein n=1 Tax=Pseudomonas parafulva TaxID=157782 RepID=UPI0018D689AB|nr:VRR-NUC domain-containing protein [Pseudomonas parafulva]MBH3346386.1 VRR-NUC domain-containing protein [Pseudomonas parafulva]
MPAPAAAAAVIWGYRAYKTYQTYEAAQTAKEIAQMMADIAARKEQVKQLFRETIDGLSKEIDDRISELAKVDGGGRSTISRRGAENTNYKQYIERKIPFRPAISLVCNWAMQAPITMPRRVRKKIPGNIIETTIEVALKQTTASLVFESIDETLGWRSPLKAEPNYDKGTKQPLVDIPDTRPKRISSIFPFWPRPRGSLAPDLVIVEYRQRKFAVPNVFAAVEIKFPKDWVKPDQIKDYVDLMNGRAKKVALLRVPEDCTGVNPNEDSEHKPQRRKTR